MVFDDRLYTEDSIVKQMALVELHSKDGSALDAGCGCIEGKHLFLVEGLAEEGKGFALTDKEKDFYEKLGSAAREIRKAIEDGSFEFPHNPFGRAYLPHGLTEEEQHSRSLQHKLSTCIRQAEIKCCGRHPTDFKEWPHTYETCSCNPVAVCRASVEH